MPADDLREPFYSAAYHLLATGGYGSLKQAALCRSIGVTTGAFYHSFENWREFTHRLLEHWRDEQTARIAAVARSYADPTAQLELLITATSHLPHRTEAAIRVWSTTDPDVAVVQAGVDADRYRIVYDAFRTLLGDDSEAARHARAGMFLLIGYEQQGAEDPELLRWSLRLLLADARAAGTSDTPTTSATA